MNRYVTVCLKCGSTNLKECTTFPLNNPYDLNFECLDCGYINSTHLNIETNKKQVKKNIKHISIKELKPIRLLGVVDIIIISFFVIFLVCMLYFLYV